MLRSLPKVLVGIMIILSSCNANNTYPQWLADVPKSKGLIYGIGTVKLTGSNDGELKKLAYYRALDEIAFASESKVESMLKTYTEETGEGENAIKKEENSLMSRITAYGIGDSGKIENEYTTEEGNYFILVSSPVKKIKIDTNKPILIKSYFKAFRELNNKVTLPWNNDLICSYESKRGNEADYEKFEDSNVTASAEDLSKLPEWTRTPYMEGAILGLGISERYKNESLFLSLQVAIANARVELAKEIQTKVTNTIKDFTEKEKVSSEDIKENVIKIVTKQSLKNSEIYKIHISDSSVYVLVGVNDNVIPKIAKDAIEASMKNDNAAWEVFKQQKARK